MRGRHTGRFQSTESPSHRLAAVTAPFHKGARGGHIGPPLQDGGTRYIVGAASWTRRPLPSPHRGEGGPKGRMRGRARQRTPCVGREKVNWPEGPREAGLGRDPARPATPPGLSLRHLLRKCHLPHQREAFCGGCSLWPPLTRGLSSAARLGERSPRFPCRGGLLDALDLPPGGEGGPQGRMRGRPARRHVGAHLCVRPERVGGHAGPPLRDTTGRNFRRGGPMWPPAKPSPHRGEGGICGANDG